MISDFLLNLAANLAWEWLQAASCRLRNRGFGDAETQALRRVFQDAFQDMLTQIAAHLDTDQQQHLDSVLRPFIADDGVASILLEAALQGQPPPLPPLRERLGVLGLDEATLPISVDAAFTAFGQTLAARLREEAGQPDSPLFNRFVVRRLDQIEHLLRESNTAADLLERIERVLGQYPTAIYGDVSGSIIITGDGNQVSVADGGRLAQQWRDLQMSDAEAEAAYRDLVAAMSQRLSFPMIGDLSFNAILEEVYELLPIARAGPGYDWRPASRSRPDEWLELDEMLQEDGPKALLGLLGEGKTTTLRYLNWAYTCRPESLWLWRLDELVPFYLTARDLARGRQGDWEESDLISICTDAVVHQLGHPHLRTALVRRVLRSALEAGNALIMVDALDEYRAAEAEQIALLQWLADIWRTRPFRDNILLLTSRPYAFSRVGFQVYALQAPEATRAESLAYRLGRLLLREQGNSDEEQRAKLDDLTRLVVSPQMRDFASPFYVTLLTLAICRSDRFADGLAQAQRIGRLADLYRFFLSQTIRWEQGKPEAVSIDENAAYLALAELGWQTFVEPHWRDELSADLLSTADRRAALVFWQRTGLLQEDVFAGEWQFYHTGFQLFGVALMLNEAWKSDQRKIVERLHEQTAQRMDWETVWELFFGLRGGEQYGSEEPK